MLKQRHNKLRNKGLLSGCWLVLGLLAGFLLVLSLFGPSVEPVLASTPATPSLLSPSNGTLTNDHFPILDWSDVTDPAGITYWIQIDNDSNFLSPERNQSGISDSTWTVDSFLGDNTWYWRVKAIDGDTHEGAWSGYWSFIVDGSSPSSPSMVSPSGNINDTTPTFDWDDVTDSSGVTYELQVDDDSNFLSLQVSKSGLTSSEYILNGSGVEVLTEDTWHWRVRAVDGASNESGWSGYWSFVVDTTIPLVPSLSSPSNGGYSNTAYPNLDWSWIDDPSGVNYELQVDNNPDFSSPELDKSNLNNDNYTITTPLSEDTYYWKVKSVDGAGNESAWSSTWSFTVDITAPSAPTLLSPADSALTNDQRPDFDWSDVTAPSGITYRIQIDDNSSFNNPERDESGLSDSTWTSNWDMWDGIWYWKVKAVDGASNESAWSTVQSLTVDASSPPTPNTGTPSGSTNDTTPTFDWEDVIDSSGVTYYFEVDNDSNFLSLHLSKSGLTSSEYTLTGSGSEILTEDNWYWRVKAIDGAGNESAWSGYWSFTVDTTLPLFPTPYSPADSGYTNTSYPNLDWSWINDPSGVDYKLQIDNNSDFSSPEVDKSNLNNNNYTVPTPLGEDTYYWKVKSVDGAGNESAWSITWSFNIDTTAPLSPIPVSPADTTLTSNGQPTFDWEDVTDSTSITYQVRVDNNSNFLSPERDQSNIGESTWQMDWHLGDGTWYWQVKAFDGAGNESAWSTAWSFELDTYGPPSPEMEYPYHDEWINNPTPSFNWSDEADAISYILEIRHSNNMYWWNKTGLTVSEYTLIAGEELTEDGEYWWRVASVDAVGNEGWNSDWRFVLDTTPLPAPTLYSPNNGQMIDNPTPHFDWQDVNDPSERNFTLQIDNDNDFSSPEIDRWNIHNADHALTGDESLTMGTWYWRVKAIDEAGNESSWSEVREFTKQMGGFNLHIEPGDGFFAKDDGEQPIVFTATLTDSTGHPISGYNIRWETDWGEMRLLRDGFTDENGQCRGEFWWPEPDHQRDVEIRAKVEGSDLHNGIDAKVRGRVVPRNWVPGEDGNYEPGGSGAPGIDEVMPLIIGIGLIGGIIFTFRRRRRSARARVGYQRKLKEWAEAGFDTSELEERFIKRK